MIETLHRLRKWERPTGCSRYDRTTIQSIGMDPEAFRLATARKAFARK